MHALTAFALARPPGDARPSPKPQTPPRRGLRKPARRITLAPSLTSVTLYEVSERARS
jgi:hypothetical protein